MQECPALKRNEFICHMLQPTRMNLENIILLKEATCQGRNMLLFMKVLRIVRFIDTESGMMFTRELRVTVSW